MSHFKFFACYIFFLYISGLTFSMSFVLIFGKIARAYRCFYLSLSIGGKFGGTPRVRGTSAIVDIARSRSQRCLRTRTGMQKRAQATARLLKAASVLTSSRAYGGALVCFKPAASLPCLGHVNARGDKVHVRAMHAWYADDGRMIFFFAHNYT